MDKTKYYIITIFDRLQNKEINYYIKRLIRHEEIDQFMGEFSFLATRDDDSDYIYLLGQNDAVYRIYSYDIISIKIEEE